MSSRSYQHELLNRHIVAHYELGKEDPVGFSVHGTRSANDMGFDIVHIRGRSLVVGYSNRTERGAEHFNVCGEPVGSTQNTENGPKHDGNLTPMHQGALLLKAA